MGPSGSNLIKQTKRPDQITIFHGASALGGFFFLNGKRRLYFQLAYATHTMCVHQITTKRVAANAKRLQHSTQLRHF